jgi:hypothetical protein
VTAELINMNADIKFHLTLPEGFWFGLGFGADSMTDAPMVLINDNGQAQPDIIDCFSKKHGKPAPNTENFFKYSSTPKKENGKWYLEVQRPIELIRDGRNETIEFDSKYSMIYAYKEGEISKHPKNQRGVFSMFINPRTQVIVLNDEALAGDTFYKVHGVVMYCSWSILTFISLVSGRYMKHLYNYRMIIHAATGTLIMTNTVIIAILALNQYPAAATPKVAHKPIGILVLVLSIIQFLGGVTVKQTHAVLKWQSKFAFLSKLAHKLFGLVIILVSNFQVVTGLINIKSPVKDIIYVHFACYVMLVIIIEILFKLRYTYKQKGLIEKPGLPEMSPLMFEKLVKNGRKLVLFNNYIVDVESFMETHPGTRFVIAESVGTEIGKYFYGAYSIETNVQPHTHSSYAAGLLEKLTIAYLNTTKPIAESRSTIKTEGKFPNQS